jgi:hypothetical protein
VNDSYILFESMTLAIKGKNLLEKKGITCRIARPPIVDNRRGCGHAVQLKQVYLSKALSFLKAENISYVTYL